MIDRSALRRLGVAFAAAFAAVGVAAAQSSPEPTPRFPLKTAAGQTAPAADQEPLKVHVFTFEHQSADDALGEIRPLFSDRGSVELKQNGDSVVLRDREGELEKILRTLRDFDHPRRALRLQFHLLRAHRVPFSPPQISEGVSPVLVARLRQMLRYDTYESMAEVGFLSSEGEQVAYDFGDDLGMEFRVGTVLQGSRIGLKDFRILRRTAIGIGGSGGVAVLHANLVLRLGQTLAMVLMRDQGAESALVVAITCDPAPGEPGS
jgi:hypothetical protein